ncbi:MAG: hypothetical protein WC764_03815 [Candidatus Paceibacterota bacterium]|jgi:hypothetical protein
MVTPQTPNSYLPTPTQSGYALLFAMFVSSIMLSIGLGISTIIYKELILSGIGRESEFSFYNAQTGLECALYSESADSAFYATADADGDNTRPKCDGSDILDLVYDRGLEGATTTFNMTINNPAPSCAKVTVYKSASNYMVIDSRGYNTACGVETNSRRVERSLKLRTNIVPAGG